jgi:hypothetical protein
MPKRNHRVLPLSEKMKFSNLSGKKKYVQFAKIYSEDKISIHQIVKRGKLIHATFAIIPQKVKFMSIVYEYLLKTRETKLVYYH